MLFILASVRVFLSGLRSSLDICRGGEGVNCDSASVLLDNFVVY